MLAARAEEMLIVILARNPSMLDFITESISAAEFVTDFNRSVFEFFVNGLRSDPAVTNLSLSDGFDEAQSSRIAFILNTTVLSDDPKTQALDCIKTIKSQNNKKIDAGQLTSEQLAQLVKKEKK